MEKTRLEKKLEELRKEALSIIKNGLATGIVDPEDLIYTIPIETDSDDEDTFYQSIAIQPEYDPEEGELYFVRASTDDEDDDFEEDTICGLPVREIVSDVVIDTDALVAMAAIVERVERG